MRYWYDETKAPYIYLGIKAATYMGPKGYSASMPISL